jgi:tRNA(fMet)-specific endonuclease VapC
VIIDTNALSEFLDDNLHVRELLSEAAGPFLPVVVLGEYRFGLQSSRERENRLRWLDSLEEHWTVINVTKKTARFYADLRQELRKKATPIPANDAWIAALALEHGLPILSNDPHFDLVPGIDRIAY